jgi:pimeloyl-ACP methyl ester carboxylesterase
MTIETRSITISYGNQSINVEYFLRRGLKETILYLHGLGCSKSDFIEAADITSLNDYTLISFDFPGHGNSGYPGRLNMDDLVEITKLFIEKLDMSDIVFIGHSMGGLVALLLTERSPDKVKAFVNVEGNLKGEDCIFSRQVSEAEADNFFNVIFRNYRIALQFSKNRGFRKCAETLGKSQPQKAIYDYCPSMVDYSDSGKLFEKFTSLKIPKCFIHGSENNGLSYIPVLKESGIDVFEIAGSNHFPQYDNPGEYYKIISDFLERL